MDILFVIVELNTTAMKKTIEAMRLNALMRLYFSSLNGLLTCSIGAFVQISKADMPARPMQITGEAVCEIPHSESSQIIVDMIKQRKRVFAWKPPAVFLSITKEM